MKYKWNTSRFSDVINGKPNLNDLLVYVCILTKLVDCDLDLNICWSEPLFYKSFWYSKHSCQIIQNSFKGLERYRCLYFFNKISGLCPCPLIKWPKWKQTSFLYLTLQHKQGHSSYMSLTILYLAYKQACMFYQN